VGGDGAFFLLLDQPEVYGLPPDPVVTTRDLPSIWGHVGVAAVTMLAAIGAHSSGDAGEGRPHARPRRRLPLLLRPPDPQAAAWKEPDVPLYLFLGGVAGASAVLAEGAAAADLPALRRVTRLAAATGAGLGTVALIHDLGRPARFLNMLRVIKPTSRCRSAPGSSRRSRRSRPRRPRQEVTGVAPRAGAAGRRGCRVLRSSAVHLHRRAAVQHRRPVVARGAPGDAVPVRRQRLGAAGGLAMTLVPLDEAGPARRLAVAGAALELGVSELMEHNLGALLAEPYRTGGPAGCSRRRSG
jgi:hypothetical protein